MWCTEVQSSLTLKWPLSNWWICKHRRHTITQNAVFFSVLCAPASLCLWGPLKRSQNLRCWVSKLSSHRVIYDGGRARLGFSRICSQLLSNILSLHVNMGRNQRHLEEKKHVVRILWFVTSSWQRIKFNYDHLFIPAFLSGRYCCCW